MIIMMSDNSHNVQPFIIYWSLTILFHPFKQWNYEDVPCWKENRFLELQSTFRMARWRTDGCSKSSNWRSEFLISKFNTINLPATASWNLALLILHRLADADKHCHVWDHRELWLCRETRSVSRGQMWNVQSAFQGVIRLHHSCQNIVNQGDFTKHFQELCWFNWMNINENLIIFSF